MKWFSRDVLNASHVLRYAKTCMERGVEKTRGGVREGGGGSVKRESRGGKEREPGEGKGQYPLHMHGLSMWAFNRWYVLCAHLIFNVTRLLN